MSLIVKDGMSYLTEMSFRWLSGAIKRYCSCASWWHFAVRGYAVEMLLVHYVFAFHKSRMHGVLLFSPCAPSLRMRFTFKAIILHFSSVLLR